MGGYISRRAAISLLSLLMISVLTFVLIETAPGSPVSKYAENPKISAADRARIAEQLGLDEPAARRYFLWLGNVARGNLGISYMTGRPVATEIRDRLPATLKLMTASFLISLALAIPIGVYSARHRHTLADHLLSLVSVFGLSVPSFWFGLLMIYLFAVWLRWLPAGGQITPWFDPSVYPLATRPFIVLWEQARYLLLPAFVLGLTNTAAWSRYLRASLLAEINENYVRTARAKGMPERVVLYKHALRNALTPLITVMGLELPAFFAGAVIIEQVFSWPGMGRLFLAAVNNRDYQVLMGVTMVTAVLVLLGNLLADALYSRLDPRVHALVKRVKQF